MLPGQAPKKTNISVFVAAAVVILLLGFAAWKIFGGGPTGGATAGLGTRDAILRLSGSNTIGASLGPTLAEAFLKDQGATDVRVVPGTNPEEKIVQGVLSGNSSVSVIKISAHGSATAFTDLADSKCDIGMASRRIKPDEATKLSSLGDMYSAASEHVLGLDGIAVIVNAGSPVSALGKDHIMNIFSGDSADWSQVSQRRTVRPPVDELAQETPPTPLKRNWIQPCVLQAPTTSVISLTPWFLV